MTFIIVDTANTFFRSRHVVRGDADIKVGMALHIMFNSIKKAWNDFNGTHVIFCLEGRSWRKDFYEPYKRNRQELREAMTVKEQEEDKLFWETFDEFKKFVIDKSNCTVLQHPQLEADDLIAGFIQRHPNDQHVVISSDSDFLQLVAPNVKQYNGITEQLITVDGVFDIKGRKLSFVIGSDSKLKIGKQDESFVPPDNWIEFALFLKCIRGDSGDNVFSAYPGARVKGTKNKVGLTEAFADRNSKGYNWNNLMLQRWTDHNKVEHRVLNDYDRNRILIDLTCQPENIRQIIDETIDTYCKPKDITQVGVRMLKFCSSFDMQKIAESIQHYAEPFQAKYPSEDV